MLKNDKQFTRIVDTLIEYTPENKPVGYENTNSFKVQEKKKKKTFVSKNKKDNMDMVNKLIDKIDAATKRISDMEAEISKLRAENENLTNKFSTTPDTTAASNYDFIVAMTTYKPRLQKGGIVEHIKSLLMQDTKLRFKMVVTIHKDDLPYVPAEMMFMLRSYKNMELIVANENLRPHLKYFYAMLKYRNLPIITVDDDVHYEKDLFQRLYDNYLKYPNCVSARRVHKIRYNYSGAAINYNAWIYEYKRDIGPSYDLFATGVGGVLYPPDILKISEKDINEIKNLALTADDIWLKHRENQMNVLVCPVSPHRLSYTLAKTATVSALCATDNITGNDRIIKNLRLGRVDMNKCGKYVNVVYITDERYATPTYVSMKSLKKNKAPDVYYYVHVICDNVRSRFKLQMMSLESDDFSIRFVEKDNMLNKYNIKKVNSIPVTACWKFFLGSIFPGMDKILYIDGDTLVLNDMYELYSTDLGDKYAGVVKDFKVCTKYATKFFKDIVKKNNGYFNSGMMLLNLKKMRDENIGDLLIQYRLNGINYFADQDALNACFGGKVLYMDPKYNYMASNLLYKPEEIRDFYKKESIPTEFDKIGVDDDVVVYHITGVKKPWDSVKAGENESPCKQIWKGYFA